MSGKQKKYSSEFKLCVIMDMREHHLGYKVKIEARQAKRIINRHGKCGKSDSSMKNSEDIGKMQYAINSPDVLADGGIAKGYSYFRMERIDLLKRFCMKKV